MINMEQNKIKSEVFSKYDVVPGIKNFIFKPLEGFSYRAGQFAFFEFELEGKKYFKHFTISNSPARENVEMTTMISRSDYKQALDRLKPGHLVYIKGPLGSFTLESLKKKTVCYIAGGIGITPVRSMLEYASDKGMDLEGALFYSNRNIQRIAFKEELEEIATRLKKFQVVHTLTELSDEEKKTWKQETGYVNEEMIKRHRPDYKECQFYVVGPPAFNKAMKEMLGPKLGIEEEFITMENFSGY